MKMYQISTASMFSLQAYLSYSCCWKIVLLRISLHYQLPFSPLIVADFGLRVFFSSLYVQGSTYPRGRLAYVIFLYSPKLLHLGIVSFGDMLCTQDIRSIF